VPLTSTDLQVPSLVDAVYAAVRGKILNGELPGGSPLTELDLASAYSVARPTAKAALERLVHDGLLRRSSNKTARVPVLESDDIRDLYFSRTFLEREVMVTLADRRYVPDAARATVQELHEAASTTDVPLVVGVDVAFHTALFDAIGSPRLNRLYQSLMGEVHLCMAQVQSHHLLSPHRIADEHRSILDAIEGGETRRAADEITSHLARACRRLVAYVEGQVSDDD
jgi:DNA-binding GntR family transcriptional regulator